MPAVTDRSSPAASSSGHPWRAPSFRLVASLALALLLALLLVFAAGSGDSRLVAAGPGPVPLCDAGFPPPYCIP